MSSQKKKRKPPKKRITTNYLALHLGKRMRRNKFIRYMFTTYGVSLDRLKHVRIRNCLHKKHLAEASPSNLPYYYIEVQYQISCPEWFHVIVHEINHVLRMMTDTQMLGTCWDYDHDAEEQECMTWEIRYMQSLGVPKKEGIKRIIKGTHVIAPPLEVWWDIEKRGKWKNEYSR